MRNPELWARLQNYTFDGGGSAPYSVKLARAEGWQRPFTLRVIEEYRRFLYLTQISARQVTPSQTVDAAWHMHLTFTRDYWEDLCPNVIGRPIHHQPCAGEEEMPRYRDQFAATKALYEAEFGSEPPSDIWGRDDATRRKSRRQLLRDETGGGGIVVMAGIAGCVVLWVAVPDAHWLVYVLIMVVAFWLSTLLERPKKRRRRGDDGGYVDSGDSGSSGETSGGGRSTTSHDKQSNGRGFWATLFDNDGDSDGGGCGGCGD